MASDAAIPFKAILIRGAAALFLILGLSLSWGAVADSHYVSLKKIFPTGKCSPVSPNYELMIASFVGGEFTSYKIYDAHGQVVEVISTFVNKDRDQ